VLSLSIKSIVTLAADGYVNEKARQIHTDG